MWAELGPAQKKYIKIYIKIESVDIKILHVLENYIFFSQFIHLYQDHE
jgi:hypothetical protein